MSRSQTAEQRFDARHAANPETGCWIWRGTIGHDKRGNQRGQLRVNARITLAHRFSYERFVGPIPAGLLVCHHCDNTLCVNPDHLFVGTQADNMQDMLAKERGAQPRGELNGKSNLTRETVLAIHALIGTRSNSSIARLCGTTPSNVGNIARGDSWAWLTGRANDERKAA